MSIIMKYMKAGTVTVNEFDNYPTMLPVMAHVQSQNLPYYIQDNGKTVFSGNLEYLEKEKLAPVSYTLKAKAWNGTTLTSTFTDFVELSIEVCTADRAGMPWYVIDDRTKKIIRKGNLDKLDTITSTPKRNTELSYDTKLDEEIDIDLALEEMNMIVDEDLP